MTLSAALRTLLLARSIAPLRAALRTAESRMRLDAAVQDLRELSGRLSQDPPK